MYTLPPSPGVRATAAAVGTHPTGMLSCYVNMFYLIKCKLLALYINLNSFGTVFNSNILFFANKALFTHNEIYPDIVA